ncbi:ribosomal protein [Paucilactobacillus vaccinostercus DSM 20634]|jgi:uncharacterized protein YsxB (DUF464 family)|uniref:Ribosomal processing cysteine protease Prp n=1 Tax=Paucilactobacillus vaccinostercus DSM 20634 TaxID=1423813 RepID=A0A0R2A5U9_9LACO|nr:ribosomal-processing cysteine protease Prp [Paucilactobacillus vaccinostercus]KRM62648.1 ribosomal protein [Paucilactobacillus vaccinostercus DSM 20634]RRG09814.1 MAG: ribosomal-processing cysteine protease Prp [Lactobacillus sp.]
MIKAIFSQNATGVIDGFSVTGHADSGPYGQDIVCAAVSGLSITIINGLQQVVGENPKVTLDEENGGLMMVSQLSDKHDTQILLKTFYNGILDMAESYSDFLTVKLDN